MSNPTPTYQAMLDLAGFTSEDEMMDVTAEVGQDGVRLRGLMVKAFGDLESGERQLKTALGSFAERVAREQAHLADGVRVEPGWLAHSARETAEAHARFQAACEQIKTLVYVRSGRQA